MSFCVVEEVDRLGLGEKTFILFTGDNGIDRTITSRMGKRVVPGGKGTLTEAGTRVPLIARWTGTVAPGGGGRACVSYKAYSADSRRRFAPNRKLFARSCYQLRPAIRYHRQDSLEGLFGEIGCENAL
jgi:hypothetical protein